MSLENLGVFGSIFRIHELISWDTNPQPTDAAALAESVEIWPRVVVSSLGHLF